MCAIVAADAAATATAVVNGDDRTSSIIIIQLIFFSFFIECICLIVIFLDVDAKKKHSRIQSLLAFLVWWLGTGNCSVKCKLSKCKFICDKKSFESIWSQTCLHLCSGGRQKIQRLLLFVFFRTIKFCFSFGWPNTHYLVIWIIFVFVNSCGNRNRSIPETLRNDGINDDFVTN